MARVLAMCVFSVRMPPMGVPDMMAYVMAVKFILPMLAVLRALVPSVLALRSAVVRVAAMVRYVLKELLCRTLVLVIVLHSPSLGDPRLHLQFG